MADKTPIKSDRLHSVFITSVQNGYIVDENMEPGRVTASNPYVFQTFAALVEYLQNNLEQHR